MYHVDVRHDELGGWGRQFGHHALDNGIGDIIQQGFDVRERAVVEIVRFVEFGNVNAGDMGKGFQQSLREPFSRGNLVIDWELFERRTCMQPYQ